MIETKPNVILLVIDCLRSDRILGSDLTCKTPNIDKLVRRGTSLPNIFVENSITTTSFTSIFTGLYSGNHGITGMAGVRLDNKLTTMAEIFSSNGYKTYAEVTGPLNPLLGIDKGFANYKYRNHHDYFFTDWGNSLVEKLREGYFVAPYFLLVHFWEAHVPVQVPDEFDSPAYGTTKYDRSISALDSYIRRLLEHTGQDTLIILTGDHGECVGELPDEKTLLPYFIDKLKLPLAVAKQGESMDDIGDLAAEEPLLLHQFATKVSLITQSGKNRIGLLQRIPMIMQLLQIAYKGYRIRAKKGLKGGGDFGLFKEKFLLFFLSVVRGDAEAALFHMVRNSLSMHVYQHGYHIYDYLQNVPIVFVKKGLFPENKRIDADLRHIDLLPTLIEALHLDAPPEGYDGTSYFSYILEGGGQDRPTYMEARGATAYAEKVFLIRGVRRENRKIAFAPYEKDAPVEYYDLSMDSQELNNLGSTEEAAKLKKEADTIATSFSQHAGQRLTVAENLELIERLKDLGYM